MLIETTLEISCNSWNIASIPRTPLYQSQFFPRPHYWLRFLRFRDDALRTHSYNGCFYLTPVERRVRLATLVFHDLWYISAKKTIMRETDKQHKFDYCLFEQTNDTNGDTFSSKFTESHDKFVLSCIQVHPSLYHVTSLSFACFVLVVLSSCDKIKLNHRHRNGIESNGIENFLEKLSKAILHFRWCLCKAK